MHQILEDLSELKGTRFGQPYPRHGLSLLWWFAHECVDRISRKGKIIAQFDPEDGDFGFHEFHNAEGLLPDTDLTYYEVGNLSHRHPHHGALPDYVTKNYDHEEPRSNMDRILVSVDSSRNGLVWFDEVYVTEHSDEDDFCEPCTCGISADLIDTIKDLEWREFTREVVFRQQRGRRS
ncbi:hypothetical protein E1301_Tti000043 [Triplophysa tibetana]|uniref:Uncharacterized protein n=1 Tax=Triplophysa tibetana TaxID=1572043 RepID=A0A5A9N589_9TELE|nr:hypothetical protein E1301_Tti000043 [Triplophysa tibetana]